jgi:NAD(P) transhydrogenase
VYPHREDPTRGSRALDVLVETVFNYPTFAECYKVAALDAYNKLGPKAPP